jgi:hypothetical protein
MLAFFTFFTTPFGKVVGILGAVIIGLALAWGALKIHDAGVRREALLEYNKRQLEQVIKDQQEQKRRWDNLEQNVLPKLYEDISKEIENTQKKVDDVEAYLNSSEVLKNDRESSEILKETLKRLGAPK